MKLQISTPQIKKQETMIKTIKHTKPFLLTGKMFLLAMSLLFISHKGLSQYRKYNDHTENIGIAAMSSISANGYGGMYTPMLYYKKDRRTYFVGPVLQNQRLNLSGLQFNFAYTIAGQEARGNEAYNENLELFCFLTSSYYFNAYMGKRTLWEEKRTNSGYEGDLCKLTFKSVEVYGGVGLKLKIFKNCKWINSVGLGGYTSIDFPGHLYYNASNMGLILKTGISYDFAK